MTAPTKGRGSRPHRPRRAGQRRGHLSPEMNDMKFTPGLRLTLAFGVALSVLAIAGGTDPFLGLGLIGYSVYMARKEAKAQNGASASVPARTGERAYGLVPPTQTYGAGQVSPSRPPGHNRLVSIFNAHQVVGLPTDQAVTKLVPFFGDAGFTRHLLNHPNVAPLLRLSAPAAAGAAAMGMAAAAPKRDDSWWQDGQASPAPKPVEPAPGSVEASSGAFWASEPSPNTDTAPEPAAAPEDFMMEASGGDVCGALGCNRTVTDFDYRCFTCRKRFCMTHRGTGVDCPACAST